MEAKVVTVRFWLMEDAAAIESEPPVTLSEAVVSVRELIDWAPELMLMVPDTAMLIVTSSPAPGTAPPDQLSLSVQLSVLAPPVQCTLAGTSRSSSSSTPKRRRRYTARSDFRFGLPVKSAFRCRANGTGAIRDS